jgi:hypothetical protein
MTEHTIIIDFMEPEMPGTLVHRVRNLAEDIERALSRGRASLDATGFRVQPHLRAIPGRTLRGTGGFPTMKSLNSRMAVIVWVMVACAMIPTATLAQMQIPGVGSMLPDKAQLLEQAQKLVADLTSMKSSGKLGAADTAKVDSLLPKATAVNTELAKPQVEPSRLAQLAGQLGDLQKQVGALKGVMK